MSVDRYLTMNTRQRCGITAVELECALHGTPLAKLANVFLAAENAYRINALYLCAHAIWESAWGHHRLAHTHNNLFPLLGNHAQPLSHARTYPSMAHSIYEAAMYLNLHHLNLKDGSYRGKSLRDVVNSYTHDDALAPMGIALVVRILLTRMGHRV